MLKNMSLPFRIALTMRVVSAEGYNEPRDAISHDWILMLKKKGWEPILIPNVLKDPVSFVKDVGIKAIIFSNGEDIHPSRYGGCISATKYNYSLERDSTEFALLEWAHSQNIPIMAVCRGLQVVNVYFGGSIVHEIEKVVSSGSLRHVATTHDIEIIDPSTRNFFKKNKGRVNSYHRHGILGSNLGSGLVPFAKTADGVIEGFYALNKPVLAVQWHPERSGPEDFCQSDLILHFLKKGPWW